MKIKMLVSILLVGLIGCSAYPEQLGFTSAEWAELTEEQQDKVMADYQKIQWTIPDHEAQHVPEGVRYDLIKLKLYGGLASFGKNKTKLPFKPVEFSLNHGSCYNVKLKSKKLQKYVKVCYSNYRVSIDPSPWNITYRQGSAFLYSSSFWRQGFTYSGIKTHGLAGLSGVTLKVKAS